MPRKSLSGPLLLSGAILLLLGGGIEYMLHLHKLKAEKERNLHATEFASQLRSHVDRELNAVIHLTSGLSSYLTVRHNSLDPKELENILATLYANSRHIRNFGIAIGYRLTYVYPIDSNKAAIGLDYRALPDQWPAVSRAIENHKPVLVGNVKLVQGGTGIIYRIPVFINDSYWGLLSTVIDSQSFSSAAFQGDDSDLYQFALKGSDEANDTGNLLWGAADLFADPQAVQVESDNGWRFAVKPAGPNSPAIMRWLVRGLGWAFAALLAFLSYLSLKHRDSMAQLALVDPLTGIPNRRLLDDRLDHAMKRLLRHPESQCVLIFIDLDGFKAINDSHGHRAGDTVLQASASRLCQRVRAGDTVGRWGGDEFLVLAEEMDVKELEPFVTRLRSTIEHPIEFHGQRFQVGASIGWAVSPTDATTPQELTRIADRRMYEDKQMRKGLAADQPQTQPKRDS